MVMSFYARLPGSLRGMLMMLVSTLSAILMHTLVRFAADGLPPFEVAFFRNSLGLLFLAPLFLRTGVGPMRTQRLPLHIIRNVLVTASMLSFFTALTLTPLAQVTALGFTAPPVRNHSSHFIPWRGRAPAPLGSHYHRVSRRVRVVKAGV